MDPVFHAYFEILQSLHKGYRAQISGLTQEELDWSPGDDMNSLAVLSAHVSGSQRYWISDIVMREESGRDREKEFATSGVSGELLSSQLDSVLAYAKEVFDHMEADQLAELRTSPRDGRERTVAWFITSLLEHTALHLGHMQITKQLLDLRQTDS